MKPKTAGLIAGSAIALGIVGYFVLRASSQFQGGNGFTVVIMNTHPEGGDINPKPGSYIYQSTTSIDLSATPKNGWQFDGWSASGEIFSTSPSYVYSATSAVLIEANFSQIGVSPIIPTMLKPVKNITAIDDWRVMKGIGKDLFSIEIMDLLYLESWQKEVSYAQFLLQDSQGNPASNQKVALYTDPMPDLTGYGYLQLNDGPHWNTSTVPALVVTTDANGIATCKCVYWHYDASGYYNKAIGLVVHVNTVLPGVSNEYDHVWNHAATDDYSIFDRYAVVQNPAYNVINTVYAYALNADGTQNTAVQVLGNCAVQCMVRFAGVGTGVPYNIPVDSKRPCNVSGRYPSGITSIPPVPVDIAHSP